MKMRILIVVLTLLPFLIAAQNNYTALNGPFGGSPKRIVSNSSGHLVGMVYGAGVFTSTDGGVNWAATITGLTNLYGNDLYKDEATGKIFYLTYNQLFTSVDGGVNWVLAANTGFVEGQFIRKSPTNGYFYIAGFDNKLYRSTNGGSTWSPISTFTGYPRDFEINGLGYLFLATGENSVSRSTNNGLSFTQQSSGITAGNIYSVAVNGSDVYALGGTEPYKSTDNGNTWVSVYTATLPSCCFNFASVIRKDPAGGIYIFHGQEIYKTVDGGTNWTNFNSPSTGSGNLTGIYFTSSTVFYAGIENIALYKTTDGGANWFSSSGGITGLAVRQIFMTDNNRLLYTYGYPYGFYLSVDDGATWDFFGSAETARQIVGFKKVGTSIYGHGSGIIKSTDNGSSWTEVFPTSPYYFEVLASNDGTNVFSFSTVYDPINANYPFHLLKSIDAGVTWTAQPVTGMPTSSAYLYERNFTINAAATFSYVMIYNYNTGFNTYQLYKIDNATLVATLISNVPSGNLRDVDFFNGKLYALTSDNKLHMSADAGQSWTSLTTPIGFGSIKIINDNTFYILGSSVYISTDGGQSWVDTDNFGNSKTAEDVIISPTNYAYVVLGYSPAYKSNAQVIPPAAPSALTLFGFAHNRVGLKWNDNSNNEDYFIIERSTGDNANYDSVANLVKNTFVQNFETINHTGLTPNTTYYFRIRASGSAGKSAYSNEVSITTPANCTPTSNIPNNRSWTGTTLNESGVGVKTDALVTISGFSGSPGFYSIDKVTVGALTPQEPNFVNIIENCGAVFLATSGRVLGNGNGTWNSATQVLTVHWQKRPNLTPYFTETTVFTLNASDPPPASPTEPVVYVNNSSSATFSWTRKSFVQEYIIERSSPTNSSFAEVGRVPHTSGSYVDTGLTLGTNYFYRVKSTNPWGTSVPSAEVSVTIQNPLFETVQIAPFSTDTDNAFSCAWANLDSDTYEDLIVSFVGIDGVVKTFKNQGNGSFTDFSFGNLSTDLGSWIAATAADYNNDGHTDLVVTSNNVSTNRIWTNQGNGSFTKTDIAVGNTTSYSPSFADFNKDGLLDLTFTDFPSGLALAPARIFQQQSDHTFTPYLLGEVVTDMGTSLSHSWADYDNDNDLDLMVDESDFTWNRTSRLYNNNGDGTFTKVTGSVFAGEAALEFAAESSSWADFDNDGDLDVFVGNDAPNAPPTVSDRLYQNNGDGTFTVLTSSLPAELLPNGTYTNSSVWGDVDNDGDLDLLVVRQPQNTLYLNSGTGTFSKHTGVEFLTANDPARGNVSAAFSDYDQDGHLDLFLGLNPTSLPLFALNNTSTTGNWVEFKLQGVASNRSAIGARITLNLPAGKKQVREITTTSGWNAQNSLIAHFGLGSLTTIPSVDIRWPSGLVQTITNVSVNQIHAIIEDGTAPAITARSPVHASVNDPGLKTLEITFDEEPFAQTGFVVSIYNQAQPVVAVKTLNAENGTRSGNKYTFDLGAPLTIIGNYYVTIQAGAFADLYGNAFAGLTSTNWIFSIVDNVPPAIAFTGEATKYDKDSNPPSFAITVTDVNGSGPQTGQMHYRKIGSQAWNQTGETPLVSGAITFNALSSWFDDMGMEYYFTAKDVTGNQGRHPQGTVSHYCYVEFGSDNPENLTLPSGGTKSSYQIIAIPHKLQSSSTSSIFSALMPEDKERWKLLVYQHSPQKWIDYPSTINRGEGYFINVKTRVADIILNDAEAPTENQSSPFTLNLKQGFNLIGNPYLFSISWADVRAANTTTVVYDDPVTYSSGNYNTSTQIDKFEGAFVWADNVINALVIPVRNASGGRNGQRNPGSRLDEDEWEINFTLAQGLSENKLVAIGMNKNASIGRDEFDRITAPRFLDYLEMNFPHPEHIGKYFSRDVVTTQDEYTWEFSVDSNLEGIATLAWDNTGFGGNNKEIYLRDDSQETLIDMREKNSYSFDPRVSKRFRIYFGTGLRSRIKPDQVFLGVAYPNPASKLASIPFTLPERSGLHHVTLEVFDNMGRKVTTLMDTNLTTDFYIAEWDLLKQDLPNGLYTYRLTVFGNDLRETHSNKIILQKTN